MDEKDLNSLAPYVHQMAATGEGTDACLELGCLPMLVHYFSPVPDIKDLIARQMFSKKSALAGIDLRPEKQLEFLALLGREYGEECRWPAHPDGGHPTGFYIQNNCFSFCCAASLHSTIRHFKPKRLLEIGSGFSSRVISAALARNLAEGAPCEYSIIDPYPDDAIRYQLRGVSRLIAERVECTDPALFDTLGDGDILFIDSSHSVKFGSDVNFLILDVLPRLQPGVVVHLHDINLPYAPPAVYFTNPKFRVFWNEEFLLQAFLAHNNRFEILLALNFLQMDHFEALAAAFPYLDRNLNWASGSFWIRRTS